jgi:hypothetical protein
MRQKEQKFSIEMWIAFLQILKSLQVLLNGTEILQVILVDGRFQSFGFVPHHNLQLPVRERGREEQAAILRSEKVG